MSKVKDGGPAFPCDWKDFQPDTGTQVAREQYFGVSVRDWFATFAPEPEEEDYKFAHAQDMTKDPHNDRGLRRDRKQIRAEFKFKHADAMLAEREKGQCHE